MIKVSEVRPSKNNEDRVVVTFQNITLDQNGTSPSTVLTIKREKQAWYTFRRDQNKFTLGRVIPEKTIMTEMSVTPFYDGQEAYTDGKHYRNVLVDSDYKKGILSRGSDIYLSETSEMPQKLAEQFLINNCYPIVKIPEPLLKYREGILPGLVKPSEPAKPSEPNRHMAGFIAFICCLLSFFTLQEDSKGVMARVIILIVCFLWLYVDLSRNSKKKAKYGALLAQYNQEHALYRQSLSEYERLNAVRQNPDSFARLKHGMVLDFLKKSESFKSTVERKKGAAEDYFLTYLNAWFAGEIHTDLNIDGDYHEAYLPDFTFKSLSTNLHIDIEIDEPYTLESRTPIHYLDDNGLSIDTRRNDYFEENNWVVIRFAEEQVIKSPDACCHLIAKIIHSITMEDKYLSRHKGKDFKFPNHYLLWSKNSTYDQSIVKSREKALASIGISVTSTAAKVSTVEDGTNYLPF